MAYKKICAKCKESKSVDEFYKRETSKDGLRAECISCELARRAKHRKANKDNIKEYNRNYRGANKEKIAEKKKAYRKANKEKYKAYCEANKEKIAERKKAYIKQRRAKDPLFRLTHVYRVSCRRAFKSIGKKKNNSSLKLLGLETWQQLAKHLSKQFYDHPKTGEKMTLDNHSFYGWHIDHIIPISTAKTEEDIIKLCHYTNLQPLWAKDNLNKGNKILDTQSII
jgi:hypothetical protein